MKREKISKKSILILQKYLNNWLASFEIVIRSNNNEKRSERGDETVVKIMITTIKKGKNKNNDLLLLESEEEKIVIKGERVVKVWRKESVDSDDEEVRKWTKEVEERNKNDDGLDVVPSFLFF